MTMYDGEMFDPMKALQAELAAVKADRDGIQSRLNARLLLGEEIYQTQAGRIAQLEAALHNAFNQFENITVADTLEIAKDRAHSYIGWYYNNIEQIDAMKETKG